MNARQRALVELLWVAALFGIALLIRTWQLHSSPPGLYLDEAAYGLDGLAARDGQWSIFYPRNNGREPLFIWLLGIVFTVADATPYTLRLTAAICGAATVVTTYWMVRELVRFAPDEQPFPAIWAASWVALFVAVSYWHLALSRLGFRAVTLPLLLTLTFALLWRGWARLRGGAAAQTRPAAPWGWALAGGAAMGLSLYTYTAARMVFLLYGALILAIWLAADRYRISRRALAQTAGATLAVALLVAAPLLVYFATHPQAFGEHAAYVSIFNERFSGGDPLRALLDSSSRTLLMMVGLDADPNLRHNPAQRPAVELLIGAWLIVGGAVSLVRVRKLTWLFGLLWFALFLGPVVLSAEGVPHSLRSIGLIPAVYLLVALGMGWVGERLAALLRADWAQHLSRWLPLPFLIFAAAAGLTSYFGAWQSVDRMRAPFFADFVELAHALDSDEAAQSLWLLPLPPGEDLAEDKLTPVDFLLDEPDHLLPLRLNEATTPAHLEEIAQDRSTVNVLTTYGVPILTDYDTRFMDLKGYLDLLLRRNLAGSPAQAVAEGEIAGFPFVSYQLADERDFALPGEDQPVDLSFGDRVRLTALNVGETEAEDAGAGALLEGRILRAPADEPLWAILRWEALQPIEGGLKASLTLRSAEPESAGRWAGQQDRPLFSDRFPREPVWPAGDPASSYLLLYPPAGAPPGRYLLELTLYDESTGQVFAATGTDGQSQTRVPLVEVELLPPLRPAAETAPQIARDDLLAAPSLRLVGVDLPAGPIAPGESLEATLHLRATAPLTQTPSVRLELRAADGEVVAAAEGTPGGESYPAERWRTGETLRLWLTLPLEAATPAGEYALVARADGAGTPEIELGTIGVQGRPRTFDVPALAHPLEVDYGDSVRLLGIESEDALDAAAGETVVIPLIWQPLRRDERALVRFVQLLDAAGQVVAQQDVTPCRGECPSSSWLEGEILRDEAELALPAALPAGEYTLLLGWYDAATQQRLAARDASGPLPDDVARVPLRVRSPQ